MMLSYTSVRGDVVLADLAHLTLAHEAFLMADAQPADRPVVARTIAQMAIRERRMLAAATEAQHRIGWGGWVWLRFTPPPGGPLAMPACTVYGEVFTLDRLERRERDSAGALDAIGQPHQDPETTIAGVREAHLMGWRYGRWYSVIEPEGEAGENHIAQLTAISRAQFEAARAAGWPEVPPWLV